MTTNFITTPSMKPVLLDEAKDYLRVYGDQEDASIAGFIAAAAETVFRHSSIVLINRDLSATVVPTDARQVSLPFRPVSEVLSVSEVMSDGSRNSLNSGDFRLQAGLFPRLHLRRISQHPLEVTMTAGFGTDWNAVPTDIQQAVLMIVSHFYTKRGDASGSALRECGATALLAPYREARL